MRPNLVYIWHVRFPDYALRLRAMSGHVDRAFKYAARLELVK